MTDDDGRVSALEARVAALEEERSGLLGGGGRVLSSSAAADSPHTSTYLAARLSLLLVTVAITGASMLTFGPTLEHSTLNHIFIESLYPISLVAWTVHEHVYAGVTSGYASVTRVNLCTLDGVHFLLSASTFFLCFAHCIVIYNWPYVVFQGVNGIAALLPFFFLPELRAALRRNAVRLHGARGASDVAVTALKRGISVLSLMTFLLTEASSCIGLSSPAQHVPQSCQYAIIDNFILNHIAFLNLFDTVIVETGIVRSRTALVQCRPSIPVSIRVCAAGAALLTIFCIGLFSTRYSLFMFTMVVATNRTDVPFGGAFQPTTTALIAPLPMLGWMVITTVVFCKMKGYLRKAAETEGEDGDEVVRQKKKALASIEMAAAPVSKTQTSAYAVEAAAP